MNLKDKKFYDLGGFFIIPLWLLMMFPQYLIYSILFYLAIDIISLFVGLKSINAENIKQRFLRFLPPVLIFSGLIKLIGVLILFLIMKLGDGFSFKSAIGNSLINGATNHYNSILDVIWPLLVVLLVFYLLFEANRKIIFKKAKFRVEEKTKLALIMALISAPYLFLYPINWTGIFY